MSLATLANSYSSLDFFTCKATSVDQTWAGFSMVTASEGFAPPRLSQVKFWFYVRFMIELYATAPGKFKHAISAFIAQSLIIFAELHT